MTDKTNEIVEKTVEVVETVNEVNPVAIVETIDLKMVGIGAAIFVAGIVAGREVPKAYRATEAMIKKVKAERQLKKNGYVKVPAKDVKVESNSEEEAK